MERRELELFFDQLAPSYDRQWADMAPVREALLLLIGALFIDLPADARVLCVGAGTGWEILQLARRFPGYHFTAVEPSAAMLEACRRRAEENGIASRCVFHRGYVESLPPSQPFDAATSLLVSQFVLEPQLRSDYFGAIAARLRSRGYLVNADLASGAGSAAYQSLLELWFKLMRAIDLPAEMVDRIRDTYERDIAIFPPDRVSAIIASGGFEMPVQFFQGGLIHAWYSTRASQAASSNTTS